jgi:hypothetical protein
MYSQGLDLGIRRVISIRSTLAGDSLFNYLHNELAGHGSIQFPSLGRGDSQVSADLPSKEITDLVMAGDSGTPILIGVLPPGMSGSFSKEDTAMLPEVLQRLAPLHIVTGSST